MGIEQNDTPVTVTVTETTTITFDYYSCEEAVKRLNEYLDHELAPDERQDVIKHLTICRPCLERFHFEENLVIQLRERMKKFCAPQSLKSRLTVLISKDR